MKIHILMTIVLVSISLSYSLAEGNTVNNLLQNYKKQGAGTADAEDGKQLWQKKYLTKVVNAAVPPAIQII